MSDIEWGPWIEHDYVVGGIAEIANIACMVRLGDGFEYGSHGQSTGRSWDWSHVTHYRIPMEEYRRIYGEPDIKADMESHPNSELDADQYTVGGDTVNMPSHYTSGEIECIDAIQAQMTPEQFAGYLRGNCIKYIWRYQHKGGKESLLKAQWYLNKLIEEIE